MSSNFIIGLGTERDPQSLPLSTKAGTRIKNSRPKARHPLQMTAARAMVEGLSSTIRLRSLSSSYNCVGLVFASRRTAIDAEDIDMILREDDYHPVHRRQDVRCGDLVVYRTKAGGEANHVAIVFSRKLHVDNGEITFECLSQWGQDGEYFHPEDIASKQYGPHREFWSERVS